MAVAPRPGEARVCNGKVYFASKVMARQRAKRYGHFVYKCGHCDGYHLTHIPPEVFRERERR